MKLPKVGELFDGRYELEGILGTGGMGCVFRALDVPNARPVAVKIVRPGDDGYDEGIEARFRREVEIIASLESPHTVTMYNSGRDPTGLLYLVFELIPGEDLATVISRSGRLDPATTGHILKQVLEALREAHEAGLLHRDVKPDNIRVHEQHGDRIDVKLLDFGIARRAVEAQSITRTGELIGTPRYMSPEQLTERALTPASDLYSLGIVAFEMLMGTASLQGNRWTDQVDRLMTGHVFSIPEIERVGRLAEIITKMCARKPEDRYPSAAAVLSVLERLDGPAPSMPTMRRLDGPVPRSTTARRLAQIPLWLWVLLGVVTVFFVVQVTRVVGGADREEPRQVAEVPHSLTKMNTPAVVPPTANDMGSSVDGSVADAPTIDIGANQPHGCGIEPPFIGTAQLGPRQLRLGETTQSWTVHIPRNYDVRRRHPLIIMFHQDAQTPTGLLAETRLDDLADDEGLVLLVPRWERLPPVWIGDSYIEPTQRGVEKVMERLCIDPEKVFVLGHGPGGRAAMRMPCVLEHVSAVATSSYSMLRGHELCRAFADIPMLNLFPMHDGNVKPEGGFGCALMDKVPLATYEATFKERNGCRGARRVHAKHEHGTCYRWTCETPFVSCHIDGGRGWPHAGKRRLDLKDCDGLPADFPYRETLWDFFSNASE